MQVGRYRPASELRDGCERLHRDEALEGRRNVDFLHLHVDVERRLREIRRLVESSDGDLATQRLHREVFERRALVFHAQTSACVSHLELPERQLADGRLQREVDVRGDGNDLETVVGLPFVEVEFLTRERSAPTQRVAAQRKGNEVLEIAGELDVAAADAARERFEVGALRRELQRRFVDRERTGQVSGLYHKALDAECSARIDTLVLLAVD